MPRIKLAAARSSSSPGVAKGADQLGHLVLHGLELTADFAAFTRRTLLLSCVAVGLAWS
jgi:hypothetical protein